MALQAFEPAKKRRGRTSKKKSADVHSFADGGIIQLPVPEIEVADGITVDPVTGSVEIENADGSITIDPTGESLWQKSDEGDTGHDENLASKIDGIELDRIAEDLLSAIQSDKHDRSQWEQMRAKCIELLGLKLEDPKGDVSRSAMGASTSVVRDPVLLEAVERFRANAYAEMCPSAGPVKVVNWSDDKNQTDDLAEALQKDLNYYLTTTASEYYPDTRYMLWWTPQSARVRVRGRHRSDRSRQRHRSQERHACYPRSDDAARRHAGDAARRCLPRRDPWRPDVVVNRRGRGQEGHHRRQGGPVAAHRGSRVHGI